MPRRLAVRLSSYAALAHKRYGHLFQSLLCFSSIAIVRRQLEPRFPKLASLELSARKGDTFSVTVSYYLLSISDFIKTKGFQGTKTTTFFSPEDDMYLQTRQSTQDPITGTSDVWSGLVANIAPLLVLAGEKHVKAYFKIMCRTSHHLLFAAAPIGLVTAVTTLIRLNGSGVLKRMIGRQFETRAELLQDLTSVSCGEVGLELIGMNLEQTINTSEEDMAMMWVHGRESGSAEQIIAYLQNVAGTMISIAHRSVATSVTDYQPRCAWSKLRAFRAKGPAAVWLARNYAAQTDVFQKILREESKAKIEQLDPNGTTTCEGVAAVYARWSDISLILTASANLDAGKLEFLRYLTVGICQAGNVGIIIASAYTSHDSRNVALVAAGLFVSSAGSWVTAWLVDKASQEDVFDLSGLSPIASGFYSKRFLEGLGLSFSPRKVVISSDTRPARTDHNPDQRKWRSSAVVVIMIMAYVGLYLGLRASAWWVSLSMLANAALAGAARSVFLPTSLYLSPMITDSRMPNPLFGDMEINAIATDLKYDGPQPSTSQNSLLAKQKLPPNVPTHPSTNFLNEPLIIDDTYEVVFGECLIRDNFVSSVGGTLKEMKMAIAIVCEMRRRNIAPLEMKNWDTPNTAKILYSDLLSQRGVWRQPLEVIISFDPVLNAEHVLAPIRCWLGRAYDIPAQKFANWSLAPRIAPMFIDLEDDEEQIGTVTGKFQELLSTSLGARLWMMAKIVYVTQRTWEIKNIEETVTLWYEVPTHHVNHDGFTKEDLSLLVGSIIGAGLTFSL